MSTQTTTREARIKNGCFFRCHQHIMKIKTSANKNTIIQIFFRDSKVPATSLVVITSLLAFKQAETWDESQHSQRVPHRDFFFWVWVSFRVFLLLTDKIYISSRLGRVHLWLVQCTPRHSPISLLKVWLRPVVCVYSSVWSSSTETMPIPSNMCTM